MIAFCGILLVGHATAAGDAASAKLLRGGKAVDRDLQSSGCTDSFVCPANSSQKPNRQCYDTFDDCQCDLGFTESGNGCVADEQEQSCPNKKIRISKFCVDGDLNDECCFARNRDNIEITLSLDSTKRYFPNQNNPDCNGNEIDQIDGSAVCVVNQNSCLFTENSPFQSKESFRSIAVGFEEFDFRAINANDEEFGLASSDQWFSDDCRPYEVQIFREFGPETTVTTCYTITADIQAGPLRGVSGAVGVSFERCEEFVEPAESFIWTIEVRPE